MGKEIGLYFRVFKVGAVVSDVLYIRSQLKDIHYKEEQGVLTKKDIGHTTLNILFTLIGYDGWLGYGLGAAYFLWDAAYGQNIWDNNIKE